MKKTILFLLLPAVLSITMSTGVQAEEKPSTSVGKEAQMVKAHIGQGMVNTIDIDAGMANITHGPINSLGWSGMTMSFQVSDKAGLAVLKPGQKIEFEIEKTASDQYVITRIRPSMNDQEGK